MTHRLRSRRLLLAGTALGALTLTCVTAVDATAATSATAGVSTTAAVSAAAGVTPDGVQGCNSNTKNWVALYPTFGDWEFGEGATTCIGDRGTWEVPSNNTEVFCAGNNEGTVKVYDRATGATYNKPFSADNSYSVVAGVWGPPSEYGDSLDIMSVTITGWTGSAGC